MRNNTITGTHNIIDIVSNNKLNYPTRSNYRTVWLTFQNNLKLRLQNTALISAHYEGKLLIKMLKQQRQIYQW